VQQLRRKSRWVGQQAGDLSLINEPAPVFSEIEERRPLSKSLASHKAYTLYKDSHFNDENSRR